jgi:thioredoxin 1
MIAAVDDRSLPLAIARPGPVLVLFTAHWCPPCRKAEAEAKALAVLRPDVPMFLAELDGAQAMALAADVKGVPSLALYRDGGLAAVRLGAAGAPAWAEWLANQLKPQQQVAA